MSGKDTDIARQGRRDRLIKEMVHDPYKSKKKLPEPTVCPECNALFHKGRWTWDEPPATANHELCPACQRIRDEVPAGFLTLGGGFFDAHRDEIMNLVHNKEAQEKADHPLKRIMAVEEQGDGVLITFTDIHLPRGVGEALHRAYEGDLDYEYTDEASIIRVSWRREE
jgi:NMD protein affecting ribosome stability and mRNA decay